MLINWINVRSTPPRRISHRKLLQATVYAENWTKLGTLIPQAERMPYIGSNIQVP